MKYFIDHQEKLVHLRQFAGDACGFVGTPVEQREFSNAADYVEQLVGEQSYAMCKHCHQL